MAETFAILWIIIKYVLLFIGIGVVLVFLYDKFFQTGNAIKSNFPFLGRGRYVMHELRPFFRQYFGDDNAFAPRVIIDWILNVASGRTGYFSFDKFDSSDKFHDGNQQMIHSSAPYNMDEMEPMYPIIGEKRENPMKFNTYFYRSAMSLGSLSFEATQAMSKACADAGAAYNTGEGGLSIHHLPNLKFSYDKKYLKYKKVPKWTKIFCWLFFIPRLRYRFIEILGNRIKPEMGDRDLYLFCKNHWVFYTIDWDAPIEVFPKPEELTDEFGHIILQIGSGMYGMRKKTKDGSIEIDWDRVKKVTSFVRAVEIKLAQGAKQTGGILKAVKNTKTIAEIRGVHPHIDLVSPNRFPFYEKWKEKEFFEFVEKLSDVAGGKPVGCKIVISDESNIEPFAKELAATPADKWPDFITIDGGDGGSATAPVALGVLFGLKVYDALHIANTVLKKHKVRDRVRVFASSKLYAPHMSAKALALGADAIGNGRSIMIAGGCIRAGVCSGEHGTCPVGMATMNKGKRRGYEQVWLKKAEQIKNYILAHNKGLIQVAAVIGVKSPSLIEKKHLLKIPKLK